MEINLSRENFTLIEDLHNGDTFVSVQHGVCMVIVSMHTPGEVTCVSLHTGSVHSIEKGLYVRPIKLICKEVCYDN